MPEYIGPVEIPSIAPSGTFPLVIDFGSVQVIEPRIIVHRFGHGDAQVEQRFYQGPGTRTFQISLLVMSHTEQQQLTNFHASRIGSYQPFTLEIGEPNGSTASYTVRFANAPLIMEGAGPGYWTASVELVEVPSVNPSYGISATETRAPSFGLKNALLGQVQTVIPLIRIALPTNPASYAYLSDRRVTVGSNLYQPRLLDWGGISQAINGEADQASFLFGNADRVFTSLVNQLDLSKAIIEFSLFHVGTEIKLDLWKGFLASWSFDAGGEFRVEGHDGLYELRLPYPARKISRQDGFVVGDQPVNVGGKKGISRITATSVINDTAYGQPLIDIYVSNAAAPLPVDCPVIAGRDESEFYAALGVVGRGPISAYATGDVRWMHTLDGVTHHGPGNLGLRRSYGGHPATGDETAIDNSPDAGSNSFALDETGKPLPVAPLDGVAFLQVRRTDEKGIQPLRPDAKKMQAWIAGGLGCWIWSGIGPYARSWTPASTNPIWITINTRLRASGLHSAAQSTQEAYFDVGAAIAAAATCDQVVDKLIGEGTETQFRFVGIVGSQEKPLRDWLGEILQSCLGYWTETFGRLKIGLRQNSSVVEAFTTANILLNSLVLRSRDPQYNDLTVSFADEEYGYQGNTSTLRDANHVARTGQALKANVNVAGVASKSQAARIVTTKLREELGGYNAAEQLAARRLSFRTTVLALNVDPGMVCSLTHADMPGGAGEFRVMRWRVNKDYSIDIDGETTTDAMYDMIVGEKPDDVRPDWIPYQLFPQSGKQRWHPNAIAPVVGDPLYAATEKSFGLWQRYAELADGSHQASVLVTGALPVNRFLPVIPPILRGAVAETTGGTIEGGKTYYIAAACYDTNNDFAPPSNIVYVTVPSGTNTNKIKLENIVWPEGNWAKYMIFFGPSAEEIAGYADVVISPPGAPPANYEITGPPFVSTLNLPNPLHERVRIKAKRLRWPGVDYGPLTAVVSGTLTVGNFANNGRDYSGRVVAVVSDESAGQPALWNYAALSYLEPTGEFIVLPDPTVNGGFGVPETGDMLLVLCKASSASSTTIADALLNMEVDAEKGNIVRIIGGTGKGQYQRIAANTANEITVDEPWTVTPDTSSVFVVELAGWEFEAESSPTENRTHLLSTQIEMPVENYEGDFLLIVGTILDRYVHQSIESKSPLRLLYVSGNVGFGNRGPGVEYLLSPNPILTGEHVMDQESALTLPAGKALRLLYGRADAKFAPTDGNCVLEPIVSIDGGETWESFASFTIAQGQEISSLVETFAVNPLPDGARLDLNVISDGKAGGVRIAIEARLENVT